MYHHSSANLRGMTFFCNSTAAQIDLDCVCVLCSYDSQESRVWPSSDPILLANILFGSIACDTQLPKRALHLLYVLAVFNTSGYACQYGHDTLVQADSARTLMQWTHALENASEAMCSASNIITSSALTEQGDMLETNYGSKDDSDDEEAARELRMHQWLASVKMDR